MPGELIVITGPEEPTRERIAALLNTQGYKVLSVASEDAAVASLGQMKLVVPDLVLSEIRGQGIPPLVAHLRGSPLTQDVPILLFANGSQDERRRALLLGISDLIQRPYDPEDVVLMVRLALDRVRERRRSGEALQGTLDMLAIPELLQSLEAGGRSGIVEISTHGNSATIWVRGGRVIDALTRDGLRGEAAFFSLFLWDEGSFSVIYGAVEVAQRISMPTTGLLLEAARRADEAQAVLDRPPFASIPDPPPLPPRELLAAHRALTLLNVASSYAGSVAQPAFLAAALEESRSEAALEIAVLNLFEVRTSGQVALVDAATAPLDVSLVVNGTARWLLRFFTRMNRAFPGRFETQQLRGITEAVSDDLESLGFYSALGLAPAPKRPAPEEHS